MFYDIHIERILVLQSSAQAIRNCFLGGQNIYSLFNSDTVDALFKISGGRDRRPNFVIFVVLECFKCWRVGGGGAEQKVLLRVDCSPGFIQGWGT